MTKVEQALYHLGAAQRHVEAAYRAAPKNWTERRNGLAGHARYTGLMRLRFLYGYERDIQGLVGKSRRESAKRMGIDE